jgi:hypothetical protein
LLPEVSTDVVTAQTPNASTSPESSAKEMILQASAGQGHTNSYGALLHLTALMSLDPYVPTPESDEERANWQGHGNGLRSALLCLAMHERELGPEDAVAVVDDQLTQAHAVLESFRPIGIDG